MGSKRIKGYLRGWGLYEEKQKRFFPPVHSCFNSPLPLTDSCAFHPPSSISTLHPPFVNVFKSKRHLTLCTYPPCGRVWGLGGWAPTSPPLIQSTFTYYWRAFLGRFGEGDDREANGRARGVGSCFLFYFILWHMIKKIQFDGLGEGDGCIYFLHSH